MIAECLSHFFFSDSHSLLVGLRASSTLVACCHTAVLLYLSFVCIFSDPSDCNANFLFLLCHLPVIVRLLYKARWRRTTLTWTTVFRGSSSGNYKKHGGHAQWEVASPCLLRPNKSKGRVETARDENNRRARRTEECALRLVQL